MPVQKKSGNLLKTPYIYMYMYVCVYVCVCVCALYIYIYIYMIFFPICSLSNISQDIDYIYNYHIINKYLISYQYHKIRNTSDVSEDTNKI